MSALYQTAGEVRAQVSLAQKMLWLAMALVLAFLVECNIPTSYTAARIVQGTIVAKTKEASHYSLSVRLPDGALQDVSMDATRYAKIEVGSAWPLTVSDATLGKPMPWQHKLLLVTMGLTLLGAFAALVKIFRTLP